MKKILLLSLFSLSLSIFSEAEIQKKAISDNPFDESLIRESNAAIQRAVNFFTDKQMQNGAWCDHPAITGLCAMAIYKSKTKQNLELKDAAVEKARKYILSFVNPDGSICKEKDYPNYSTAVCLATLAVINNPEDYEIMKKARKYLIRLQCNEENPDTPMSKDNPFYGGIGYGSAGPGRPDLSNTQWALEALYLTEFLDKEPYSKDPKDAEKSKLAWKNAVLFLSRLQNLPESNDQVWVVKDKNDPNYGGFVYKPDESKASLKFEDKKTLRSYGSMTYAGLKSMIYAKLSKDDPRVQAAVEWAAKNYTLDENPGMGPEGHFYYLNVFAKAHSVLGEDIIKTDKGEVHNWRVDLVKKLLELQKGDGSWKNDKHGRWMESIPELVTAYSLLAMEAALAPYLN
ncbi:MAG TPA: terpene cyclase/mutase family protein [Victivallales bacterium]|nr:terpene cyclase/mutase family protein [Victivallales bacterium]HPO90634.1 terpene cyclase/mutase family protein [Victivallales bacterium]HRR05835.1 terpene cyclase/mutase family protein [Victivallales bacterium]HRR28408.1 terpene cyclase/mutase family protein [Victivallales bacterium]HRU00918.1 terpene cyclase/mutase family protein [Victivallales bacterium]